jgi:hypothetical protein
MVSELLDLYEEGASASNYPLVGQLNRTEIGQLSDTVASYFCILGIG